MKITKIIIHCTATPFGRNFTTDQIDRFHRQRGFRRIGYHYVIYLDGTIAPGRPESSVGAHCLGQNRCSIGVANVGGLDAAGHPADTRTPAQKQSLIKIIRALRSRYPSATVHGHREFAAKACPCFDAAAEYRGL